jgi:hypothetical protein
LRNSSIDLEEIEQKTNLIEELEKLEIELMVIGYSEKNIREIKESNNAKSTKDYIDNLQAERSCWNN